MMLLLSIVVVKLSIYNMHFILLKKNKKIGCMYEANTIFVVVHWRLLTFHFVCLLASQFSLFTRGE
jgi:hypothetical protein